MNFIVINPQEEPMRKGESWWIVHPNIKAAEFKVPHNASALCTKEYRSFKEGTVYSIVSCDNNNGWIMIQSLTELVKMPHYVFARYFDAEAFVKHVAMSGNTHEPILPLKPKKQLELFSD